MIFARELGEAFIEGVLKGTQPPAATSGPTGFFQNAALGAGESAPAYERPSAPLNRRLIMPGC